MLKIVVMPCVCDNIYGTAPTNLRVKRTYLLGYDHILLSIWSNRWYQAFLVLMERWCNDKVGTYKSLPLALQVVF